METHYKKQGRPARGIRSYEDFREMLEKETDIQGVINITPDHQHGPINIAALKKGKAAISHKPVASVLHEVRRTVQAARDSAAPSHLLAYSNSPDRHTLEAWMKCGEIGTIREVHNWTNRPFWPQGMQEYHKSGPPVPDGFNWALWQGPEPDRIYHPAYTFAVYRGWYAYGTGCLGDMGHYSLWQPYRILKLGVPEFVEGRPNNDAYVGDNNVSTGGRVSQVALPKASSMRWRHPATADRPAVDTFWYDGGMKPETPEEVYENGEDLADEGMLIVGDKGKILCDFRANNPRLIPQSRQQAFEGSVAVPEYDKTTAEDEWVNAIKNGKKSKGSFEEVSALAEAVTLANIALRVPYKRLIWDAQKMEFTNSPEATKLIRREQYREGWEKLFGIGFKRFKRFKRFRRFRGVVRCRSSAPRRSIRSSSSAAARRAAWRRGISRARASTCCCSMPVTSSTARSSGRTFGPGRRRSEPQKASTHRSSSSTPRAALPDSGRSTVSAHPCLGSRRQDERLGPRQPALLADGPESI